MQDGNACEKQLEMVSGCFGRHLVWSAPLDLSAVNGRPHASAAPSGWDVAKAVGTDQVLNPGQAQIMCDKICLVRQKDLQSLFLVLFLLQYSLSS